MLSSQKEIVYNGASPLPYQDYTIFSLTNMRIVESLKYIQDLPMVDKLQVFLIIGKMIKDNGKTVLDTTRMFNLEQVNEIRSLLSEFVAKQLDKQITTPNINHTSSDFQKLCLNEVSDLSLQEQYKLLITLVEAIATNESYDSDTMEILSRMQKVNDNPKKFSLKKVLLNLAKQIKR